MHARLVDSVEEQSQKVHFLDSASEVSPKGALFRQC